jgi:hypothetical protein
LTTDFTVVPRPVCPQANQYYQSSDDSEFGCLVNGVWLSPPAAYTCPTGYNSFDTAGQTTQWGCRVPGKLALTPSQIAQLSGAALNVLPSSGATPKPTAPPATSNPVIKSITWTPPKDSLWRPNSGIVFTGEHLNFTIVGNIPNNGGYDPNSCAYTVQLINSQNNQVLQNASYTQFNTWDFGAVNAAAVYKVNVVPDPNAGWAAPCGGSATLSSEIVVVPQRAWVTGLQLSGFGHHFAGGTSGDAWSGQWCQNCNSIFSPAHDTAFLEMVPTLQGTTPGGSCAYNVTFNGHSFDGNNSMNLGQALEVVYQNGQPGLPASQPNLYSGYNPFWSQWSDNSNTAEVTISPGNDLVIPPCYVIGGKITKSVTFTNNPSLPPVIVH